MRCFPSQTHTTSLCRQLPHLPGLLKVRFCRCRNITSWNGRYLPLDSLVFPAWDKRIQLVRVLYCLYVCFWFCMMHWYIYIYIYVCVCILCIHKISIFYIYIYIKTTCLYFIFKFKHTYIYLYIIYLLYCQYTYICINISYIFRYMYITSNYNSVGLRDYGWTWHHCNFQMNGILFGDALKSAIYLFQDGY